MYVSGVDIAAVLGHIACFRLGDGYCWGRQSARKAIAPV